MTIVEITSWHPGFQKVSCTELLHSVAGIGLAEAKGITDALLAGNVQRIKVLPSVAADLVTSLQQLGASAHIVLRA